METLGYDVLETEGGVPIKAWTKGVALETEAKAQLRKIAKMPFVGPHVAVMPDVHAGIGATVGSVIATKGAVIPAAVGVDIGCGMMAVRTSLEASQLPESLRGLREAIERAVPVGRTDNGGRNDRGAWQNPPEVVTRSWKALEGRYQAIVDKHRVLDRGATYQQLGTLGTGNHFIEICLDEADRVWVMLHSGSRGVGNRIGTYFIDKAREEMLSLGLELADRDLAYLREGTQGFDDYVEAVSWAQDYAAENRELMMRAVIGAMRKTGLLPPFEAHLEAVNCHHNYISRETHFGEELLVTRKGAVRARKADLGIIPGSMGARSYIVRGRENPEAFHSCSHGAGRALSRTAAKKRFTVADHEAATAGVECRKDEGVIDETPGAYKPIDDVMRAQADLVEIVHQLRQVVCVKG